MKKYLALAGVIALSLGANSLYNNKSSSEALSEYILQGAKKVTMVKDVNSVGGVILHEYSIIDAVSVRLSSSQLAEIKKINPMLRWFKDQEIKVASVIQSFSSDNISFNLVDQAVTWKGINNSDNPIVINAIDFNMPKANKKIESITINGVNVSSTNIRVNGSLELQSSEFIELAAGQTVDVELKFTTLGSTDANEYQLTFGETMPTTSLTSSIDVYSNVNGNNVFLSGKMIFEADSNEVSWTVENPSDYIKELKVLFLDTPDDGALLNALYINDVPVNFSLRNKKLTLASPIAIPVAEEIDIRVGFDLLSSADSNAYKLDLQYTNDLQETVIVPANITAFNEHMDTHYPTLVRADLAHQMGITGFGVTVAILDTGLRDLPQIKDTASRGPREITIAEVSGQSGSKGRASNNDENGHGTHLASIITNSSPSVDENGNTTGSYNGIAPDANLVVVKAFDIEGQSSYLDIIAAVEYVVENKDVLNIKVLNLSFSAIPSSYYWDDPLNQALMAAWDAGITVIAAAGNRGPEAMTIGVPGNTPYVITVGAVSDNYTPHNGNDDFVTSFSSAGPTYEGFVKPEVVAPGGHIQGVMDRSTLIRETYALFENATTIEDNYFAMSGSSQSTAITSGIVALMLQANPNLSPDDIKCRLIETARAATNDKGALAFSVFQQGAGLVDAMAAIESTETGCSNTGLSISKDLSGEEHFIGPARRHENEGDYYIPGVEGLEWSGVYSDSQLWRHTSFNADSQLWRNTSFNSDSQLWRHTSFMSNSQLWRNTSFSADSQLWRNTSFNADSQLWRNTSFNADSQLWRDTSFNSDSIPREWVNHE